MFVLLCGQPHSVPRAGPQRFLVFGTRYLRVHLLTLSDQIRPRYPTIGKINILPSNMTPQLKTAVTSVPKFVGPTARQHGLA